MKYRLKDNHPTMVKVHKVLDLMYDLGITIRFPYANPYNLLHAVTINDGDNQFDLVGIEDSEDEREGIDSFGKHMFDYKLIQYKNEDD